MSNFAETGVMFKMVGFDALLKDIKTMDTTVLDLQKTTEKLVGAFKKLETGVKNLDTQLKNLTKTQTTVNRKFLDMSKRVTKLSDVMQDTTKRVDNVTNEFEDLTKEQADLIENTKKVTAQTRLTDSALRSMSTTLRGINLSRFGGGLKSVGDGAFNFRGGLSALNDRLSRFKNLIGNIATGIFNLGKQLLKFTIGGLAIFTTGVLAATTAGLNWAISIQDSFAGVTKTVDGLSFVSSKGILTLTDAGNEVQKELINISNRLGIEFERIASIAQAGGQLGLLEGIDPDEFDEVLGKFSLTIGGLAEATDLTEEAAGTGLARISGLFKDSFDDIGDNVVNLGNTLVLLGNKTKTTESEILGFANRLAGTAATVGFSQAGLLSFSASFTELGLTAESGATSVQRVLLEMQKAFSNNTGGIIDNTEAITKYDEKLLDLNAKLVTLETQTGLSGEELLQQRDAFLVAGGSLADFGRLLGDTKRKKLFDISTDIESTNKALKDLQAVQGQAFDGKQIELYRNIVNQASDNIQLSADELRTAFEEQPEDVLLLFIEGLAKEGKNASSVLDDLGFSSTEVQRTFLTAANSSETFRVNFERAVNEFSNGNALMQEVETRLSTLRSKLNQFTTTVKNTTATLFSDFIPSLSEMVDTATKLVPVFGEQIPKTLDVLKESLTPITELFGIFNTGSTFDVDTNKLNKFGEFITPIEKTTNKIESFFETLRKNIKEIDFKGILEKVIKLKDFIVNGFTFSFNFVRTLFEKIPLIFGKITTKIKDIFSDFDFDLEFEGGFLEGLSTAFDNIINFIDELDVTNIKNIANSIGTAFNSVVGLVSTLTNTDIEKEGFSKFVKRLGNAFSSQVVNTLNTFSDLLSNIGTIISGFRAGDFDSISNGITNIVASIITLPAKAIDNLTSLFGLDLSNNINSFINAIENGKNIFQEDGFFGLLRSFELTQDLPDTLVNIGQKIKTFFTETLPEAKDNLIEFILETGGFQKVVDTFKQIYDESIPKLREVFTNFVNDENVIKIKDALVELGNKIIELVSPSLNDLGDNIITNLLEKLQSVSNFILGAWTFSSLLLSGTLTVIGTTINTVIETFSSFLDALSGASSVIIGFVEGDFEMIKTGFLELGGAIVEGILTPIKNFGGLFSEEFKTQIELVIENVKTYLGIASPSTVFIEIFKLVGLGALEGIKQVFNLDSFLNAMFGDFSLQDAKSKITGFFSGLLDTPLQDTTSLDKSVKLPEFEALTEDLNTSFIPTFTNVDDLFLNFYTNTLPQTTLALTDGLIPAKNRLVELNNTMLIPSVLELINTENILADTLTGIVQPSFDAQVLILESAEDASKDLRRELKKLTEQYKTLEAAIRSTVQAGSGIPTGLPVSSPGGGIPEFATGGDFIVPQNVPNGLKTKSGGMLMGVHPGERVIVQPNNVVASPSLSGAGIQNFINNNANRTQTITNNNKTNNVLNVKEAVSPSLKDSFRVLQVIG